MGRGAGAFQREGKEGVAVLPPPSPTESFGKEKGMGKVEGYGKKEEEKSYRHRFAPPPIVNLCCKKKG